MTPKRPPGRPREFCREDALRAAMHVFWRQGFEGTSLTDLTTAMQISRPTLYAAFGDKVTLFREAVLAYTSGTVGEYEAALALPKAREVAEAWLRVAGHLEPAPDVPSGCMILQGAFVGSADTAELRAELTAMRRYGTKELTKRFERAVAERDLPEGTDPQELAEYLTAVAIGLTVGAVDGLGAEQRTVVARRALLAWLEPSHP